MKSTLLLSLLIAASFSLTGCAWIIGAPEIEEARAFERGTYLLTEWSGGRRCREYFVKDGIITKEKDPDGLSFVVNGKMRFIAGNITVEQM